MPKRSFGDTIAPSEESAINNVGRYQTFVDECLESLPKRARKDNHQSAAELDVHLEQDGIPLSPSNISFTSSEDELDRETHLADPALIPWTHKHHENPESWSDLHPTELHTNRSMLTACMYLKKCDVHHPAGPSTWRTTAPGESLDQPLPTSNAFTISTQDFQNHFFEDDADSDPSDLISISICSAETEDSLDSMEDLHISTAQSLALLEHLEPPSNFDSEDDSTDPDAYTADLETELEYTEAQLQKWVRAYVALDEEMEMEEELCFLRTREVYRLRAALERETAEKWSLRVQLDACLRRQVDAAGGSDREVAGASSDEAVEASSEVGKASNAEGLKEDEETSDDEMDGVSD